MEAAMAKSMHDPWRRLPVPRLAATLMRYCAAGAVVMLLTAFFHGLPAANAQQVIQVQQDAPSGEDAEEAEERPQIRSLPPAYNEQMLKLAEALGSLHYLRALCGADEGQTWREEMERLLAAEDPSPDRRAQLIAAFNRGFRSWREIYRECTPAAAEAANRFLTTGMRLASEIPSRYGR